MSVDETNAANANEPYGTARKFYETLLKTEWTTPDKLASYQEDLVRDVLGHAIRTVPYHRKRLKFLL
ncbi:MAG: hypothetical protein ACR2PM_07105, partial [Hyphomicrobiales bacterium]